MALTKRPMMRRTAPRAVLPERSTKRPTKRRIPHRRRPTVGPPRASVARKPFLAGTRTNLRPEPRRTAPPEAGDEGRQAA